LSKGFGFAAHGAPLDVPTLTLAHEVMVLEKLEFAADSVVQAYGTPSRLVLSSSLEKTHSVRVLSQT
jgi:hypothetical protein